MAKRNTRVFFDAAYLLPDDIAVEMDAPASFVCPNCDGEITEAEHDQLGVCGDCYFAVAEAIEHQHACHA